MGDQIGFEVTTRLAYEEAVERTTAVLKEEGFGVLTTIDVRATFREKLDKEFRPYVILGACNPVLAHQALTSDPRVGLLMPCNVTVESRDGGGSTIRVMDPDILLTTGDLAGNAGLGALAREAGARVKKVVAALEAMDTEATT